ncbi:MAG TPA: glutamyl-tRNA reductase [Limnobacter sp.]|uniref:glutamyl-tRNA reductase n=1 Tax=Limnobacter sp. TaxID=2003368 RepID=UPI002EDA1BFF
MELFAVGLNYQSAPLALRERLAFPAEQLAEALQGIRQRVQAPEAAILSTCNRTEVYCAAANGQQLEADLLSWLSTSKNIPPHELRPHLYVLPHTDVVRHAFRVASGLDSMVLGEAQILGQMKQAARTAEEAGTLGQMLHQLFQRTFSVAKEVRSHTEIGAHSVSMASAAVKLAQRIFGDLSKRNVLFIGAGEMIQLCATHFAAQHPKSITIANRSAERAHDLAQTHGGQVIGLGQIPEQLANSDIVVSCTASTLPLIGLGMVQQACKRRKHAPMFMLDLAVPRDIEAQVANLDDVFLYTVDDLSQIVQEGREHRAAAVEQAEAIIETQVQGFMRWMSERSLVPVIQQLHQRADDIAQLELEHAQRLLAKGTSPEEVLQLMAHRMSAKFMHGPMQALHKATPAEREQLLQWLPDLFQIKHPNA